MTADALARALRPLLRMHRAVHRTFRPVHRALLPLHRLRDPNIVPDQFKREADRLAAHRYRAVTVPSARRLFARAAWKYRLLRGYGERRRGPGGWRKRHCNTYIVACLRLARPLASEAILFQAMAEAFGENFRTIERAWRKRAEAPRRRRKTR